jgi:hypothetical protein
MKRLYHFGLAIDTILLLIASGSALMMTSIVDGLAYEEGLTPIGRIAMWAIPLALLGLLVAARLLRARGALIAANVVLWLPALPFALSASVWVALWIAFAIGSR